MNNLPKSWCVKNDGSQLFKDTVIEYLNYNYCCNQIGCLKYYYGIYSCRFEVLEEPFATILTIQQFIEMSKEIEVLPEKWCIKKDKQEICDWFNVKPDCFGTYSINSRLNEFIHHPSFEGLRIYPNILKDYTEITFEQFQKHILKRDMKKEIIGYKTPISFDDNEVKVGETFIKYLDSYRCERLVGPFVPKEIAESWEPVYKPEFKVGDWVVASLTGSYYIGKYLSPIKLEDWCSLVNSYYYPMAGGNFGKIERFATKEEIAWTQTKIFKMTASNGDFELEVSKKGIYYKPEDKWLPTSFNWANNFTEYTKMDNNFEDSYSVKVEKIKVGCKNDTLVSQWKEVYEYYNSIKD